MVPLRIAVVRTDRLGDMVLTLPMFSAIRAIVPGAHCTLITRSYVRPLLLRSGGPNAVVYLDEDERPVTEVLRTLDLDVIFFPRPRFNEVWAAVRAGIRRRVGTAFRWYSPLFTTRVRDHRSNALYHEAEYNVRMVAAAFNSTMPPVQLEAVSRSHRQSSGTSRIIIHPGSGGSAPEWPAERFGELAALCAQLPDVEIVVTGIQTEIDACNAVVQRCSQALNVCGTLDLDAMIDLVSGADVVCANSTGVIHVAAAAQTPVVGFYPHTPSMSARRWGPYTNRAVVLETGPSDNMEEITVPQAYEAVLSALQMRR